jgi:hypothetical protein
MRRLYAAIVSIFILCTAAHAQDFGPVEKVFERKGEVKGQVFKVSFPRTDLKVELEGMKLDPEFALVSWAGFMPDEGQTAVMGDLCLTDAEAPKAVEQMMKNGFDITAIHQHLMSEKPRIIFVHYAAKGDPVRISEKLKQVLQQTATPIADMKPDEAPKAEWSDVEAVLGGGGERVGRVLKMSFPRPERIAMNGMEIPPAMGSASEVRFQRVGDEAAVNAELVLMAKEVNPVMRLLTGNNIRVAALHSHMLNENPRLFYLHAFGKGKPSDLARTIKEALAFTGRPINAVK